MQYLYSFLIGGAFCVIGQILIDRTKLTPARILSAFLLFGFLLSVLGLYQHLADFAGAGATIPLSGFGHLLAKGTREAVMNRNLIGAFTGGVTAAAAGISGSIAFGFLCALIFNTHMKK